MDNLYTPILLAGLTNNNLDDFEGFINALIKTHGADSIMVVDLTGAGSSLLNRLSDKLECLVFNDRKRLIDNNKNIKKSEEIYLKLYDHFTNDLCGISHHNDHRIVINKDTLGEKFFYKFKLQITSLLKSFDCKYEYLLKYYRVFFTHFLGLSRFDIEKAKNDPLKAIYNARSFYLKNQDYINYPSGGLLPYGVVKPIFHDVEKILITNLDWLDLAYLTNEYYQQRKQLILLFNIEKSTKDLVNLDLVKLQLNSYFVGLKPKELYIYAPDKLKLNFKKLNLVEVKKAKVHKRSMYKAKLNN